MPRAIFRTCAALLACCLTTVLRPPLGAAALEPGVYLEPAHASPGQRVVLRSVGTGPETEICAGIVLSIAESTATITSPADSDLAPLAGNGHGLKAGSAGQVFSSYDFVVPRLPAGTYVVYALCPANEGLAAFGPATKNTLLISIGAPATDTIPAAPSTWDLSRALVIAIAALFGLATGLRQSRGGPGVRRHL